MINQPVLLGSILILCLGISSCTSSTENRTTIDMEGSTEISPSTKPQQEEPGGAIILEVGCKGEQSSLVTSFDVIQTPEMGEMPVRTPFRDPVFGTCLVRVTDREIDPGPEDAAAGMKNEYSRVQSFNSNDSRLLVRTTEGTWYIYNASTLQPIKQVSIDVDPRWSATDPDLLYFSSETRLMSLNVNTDEQNLVHDFKEDAPESIMVWTRYEGSPSADGRYWGLMAEDDDWLTSTYLLYDLQNDTILAKRDLRKWHADEREMDSVYISPLGNYFLAQMDKYCEPGKLGSDANPCGLMVYDRTLQNGRGLLRVVGHSDTALDPAGREVLVYQDIDTDSISMLDLETGAITPLWSIDFSHTAIGYHFSGRATDLPGWVLVSTYDGDPKTYTWMDDSLFAVELKQNGKIVRLAHTHSLVDENMEHDYWAEPQASVNQDFTRILFTTNWGRSGTSEVEMYLLLLPVHWKDLVD